MDGVDEAEGRMPVIQPIENEIKLLYTSFLNIQTPFDLVSFIFAIFLVIFGAFAYYTSGSLISLLASVLISIPIFIGSVIIFV